MELERGKIVCVGDHLAVAAVAASKGDVQSVRRIVSQRFDLDHAERSSVLALEKLQDYLEVAERIEAKEGVGSLLDINDPMILGLVSHGCFSPEQLLAAERYRHHNEASSKIECLREIAGEANLILQRRRVLN